MIARTLRGYLPEMSFLAGAVLVTVSFWGHGFVFLLDMVWAPVGPFSEVLDGGLRPGSLFSALFWFLGSVFSAEAVQKALLTSLLFLCGFSMYRLVSKMLPTRWAAVSGWYFMFNPWVYERFLAGHWKVLLGYALLPLVVKLFLVLLERRRLRDLLAFSIAMALYPMASLHWAYISIFFLSAIGASNAYLLGVKSPGDGTKKPNDRKIIVAVLIFLAILLAANAHWVRQTFEPSGVLESITNRDFRAYSTVADPVFGAYFNVLSLYGFWQDTFFLPKDTFSVWWVPTVIVLVLSLFGAIAAWNDAAIRKKSAPHPMRATIALAATASFIPAMLIATGYARDETRLLVDFLAQWLPAFKGLRETMKVAGILAFCYALLVPMGSLAIFRAVAGTGRTKMTNALSWVLFGSVAVIPLLWAGGHMFWGFNGQLTADPYPAGWYETKHILSSSKDPGRTLFLPWHAYPRTDFAGNRRVANPGKVFFGLSTTVGKNIDSVFYEIEGQKDWDDFLFRLLNDMESPAEAEAFFASHGIGHVILAKIDDFDRYGFLRDPAVFERVFEDESIALYRLRPRDTGMRESR